MADLKYRVETAATPGKPSFGLQEAVLATAGTFAALASAPLAQKIEKQVRISSVAPLPASPNSAGSNEALTGPGYRSLEMKLEKVHAQLSGAISSLDARLNTLIGHARLGEEPFVMPDVPSPELVAERATRALELNDSDTLALVLDEAADAQIAPLQLLAIARQCVFSDSSLVRTAAARLLAVGDPALAREVLPSLIERASGRTAKHILQVAFRQVA